MTYIRTPIETNPSALAQDVYDYIQTYAPNWVPADGNLDVWIIKAVAQLAAESRSLASDVQDDIFRYFGASLMGIPPLDGVAASGNTTWTLSDSLGHTISAGTLVAITDANGDLIPFTVVSDVTVPNGNSATGSGAVLIQALSVGADGNGLGAVGSTVQLIDVLDWVTSVVLTGTTTGGADAETDTTYLTRLATRLQRLSQRPILPADFSAMALDASSSVARAVAIDGFNPSDSTYNNQRMVAVAAIDANGAAVSSGVKSAIQAYLQANREVNFVVNVINPNFTTINVATTVIVPSSYSPSSVQASVIAAIQGYLNPSSWGQDPSVLIASGGNTWVETPKVYYNEVITLISNVQGVSRVSALTLNGGTADITLTTPAALAQYGTVTVTTA